MNDDADGEVRELIVAAIKGSRKQLGHGCRKEIADRMSARLGRTITASMLNSFTRQDGRGQRIPAVLVRSFCEATGNEELAIHMLPEHLREILAVGQHIADGSLDKFGQLISTSQMGRRRK